MESTLTFQYDREADILYINTCPPYPEQETEELSIETLISSAQLMITLCNPC
jgi:uncharacterized protein YuzE